MPIYNKLVRDRIPEIIKSEGKQCRFFQIQGVALVAALRRKLFEELEEFTESEHDLEELVDILEVVDALATQLGSTFKEIITLKEEKKKQRGGFEQGIFLEWVED